MAVVYTHTRLDNGSVFYVGIGTENRAYDKRSRSDYWKRVVNKHDYRVDITHTGLTYEEACSIEKYLICFYGRSDLGLGALVNMTDGGEDNSNRSKESINKQIETAKKNGTYKDMCERMVKYARLIDRSGANSSVRREVYVYSNNGYYFGHYDTLSEFCRKTSSPIGMASLKTDTGMSVNKYYLFSKYMGEKIRSDQYTICDLSKRGWNNTKKIKVRLVSLKTSEEMCFNTTKDASLFLGKNPRYLSAVLLRNKKIVGEYKIFTN
jgi:hypothetical protein